MTTIPLLVPSLPTADQLLPWLRRIDVARWYSNFGPLVKEFEERLLHTLPASPSPVYLTTVSSGTIGLELALLALDLPKGSRVLIPSFTFVATAIAALRAGLTPVVADIDPTSWLLTPSIAAAALKRIRFDAVMPVSTFGCPQLIADWSEFSELTGMPVIVDAAGALGNQAVGGNVIVVFSLHATKALGVGEGGFVVASDKSLIQRIRQYSNFGISPENGTLEGAGSNGKMSEYHAAVGLAGLETWPSAQQRRRALMQDYQIRLLAGCPQIEVQQKPIEGVYSIMAVALPKNVSVVSVASRLGAAGIQTRTWYSPPIHRQPCFSQLEKAGTLPVTEALSIRMLGLPFHLGLTSGQLDFVCEQLAAALEAKAEAFAAYSGPP